MHKYTVKLHLYTDMPEKEAEQFVTTWVEEARWHLKDGGSWQLVKLEQGRRFYVNPKKVVTIPLSE